MAFYQIDPWGDQRADLRSAILAMVMANAWRGKDTKALKPEAFMPFPDEPTVEKQSAESMAGVAQTFATMFGSVIKAQ